MRRTNDWTSTRQPVPATPSGHADTTIVPEPATGLETARARRQGIALFLGALLAFASYDAFAKYMLATHPPVLVNVARYVAVVAIAVAWLASARRSAKAFNAHPASQSGATTTAASAGGTRRRWHQPHLGLLMARSLMLAIVATSFMTALVSMPLAEATAIYFTSPLLMVALSPWLLKESVGQREWLAVALGFAGMLLIVRPGSNLPLAGTLLMALSAVCYALFQLLTRKLSGKVAPHIQYAHMAFVCLVVTSGVGLALSTTPLGAGVPGASLWPTPRQAAVLLAGGACSGLAQFLLLAAFRRAPASVLGPLNYVQLMLAVLLSALIFHRMPDGPALAGMICIAAAGVYLAWPRR